MSDLSSSLRALIDGSSPEVDVDAIVRARRKRRSRRRIAIASFVAVIVVVASVSVLARPASEHKLIAVGGTGDVVGEAAATRAALAQMLIVTPGEGAVGDVETRTGVLPVRIVDPRSGASHSVPFPIPGVRELTYPYLARGSNAVVVAKQQLEPVGAVGGATGVIGSLPSPLYSTAYVASSTFEQWRSLGAAEHVIPGTDPDEVWVVDSQTVREVRLDGGYGEAGGRLTLGRDPIAAVTGGLLTSRRESPTGPSIFEVWNPVTGHAVRRVDIGASPLAVSGSKVVWIDADRCVHPAGCRIHVTDVTSGGDRVIGAAPGRYWGDSAAFSPDGQRVALVAYAPASGARDVNRRFVDITIVDVATGAQVRRTVKPAPAAITPSWSPDGSLLFFVRDPGHLGYFNAGYPDSEMHDLAIHGADAYALVAKPAATPVDQQQWVYDGPVGVSQFHSAELCVYASTLDLSPYSDSCGGPLVAGWDPSRRSGTFHLVGTYDDGVFTLTQSVNTPTPTTSPLPASSVPPTSSPPRGFASGCATPPGGWKVDDPAKVTFASYTAVTNAARETPGYAGTWVGPYTTYPGVISATLPVLNFGFRGDLDVHRQALRAIYGGPICVVQRGHTYAELQAIVQELFGDYGRNLGLEMTEGGPDDLRGTVHARAIAVSPATRRALDQRFGTGVVDISSVLTPLP